MLRSSKKMNLVLFFAGLSLISQTQAGHKMDVAKEVAKGFTKTASVTLAGGASGILFSGLKATGFKGTGLLGALKNALTSKTIKEFSGRNVGLGLGLTAGLAWAVLTRKNKNNEQNVPAEDVFAADETRTLEDDLINNADDYFDLVAAQAEREFLLDISTPAVTLPKPETTTVSTPVVAQPARTQLNANASCLPAGRGRGAGYHIRKY